jgi:hypothetical protein
MNCEIGAKSFMPRYLHKPLLLISILWIAWLLMMLVHESGHVLGATLTGGTVQRMVWYPTIISRTDVSPNPHPLIEVWAGPIVGAVIPLLGAIASQFFRLSAAYLVFFFAGFCLIANGAYIGLGAICPIGDGKELINHGVPNWTLAVFGFLTVTLGLWIWHRVSPRLGFGPAPVPINVRHVYAAFAIALALTLMSLVFGNRGI